MTGSTAYALSRKYTEETCNALGFVKGANCTIESTEHKDGVTTITFKWTGNDGTERTTSIQVFDGTPIYVWESGNTYHYGDLAIYESNFYRCIVENSDVTFDNTKWNEIGSPDGNYDIVANSSMLPARFTAADRKMYYSIEDGFFWLWNGIRWVSQEIKSITSAELAAMWNT